MPDLLNEIVLIISLQLGEKNVLAEHHLIEDLGAESADIANIIAVVEEKYQLFINEEMISKIRTVQDLHVTIRDQLSKKNEI